MARVLNLFLKFLTYFKNLPKNDVRGSHISEDVTEYEPLIRGQCDLNKRLRYRVNNQSN
ncbi:hypothetical protein ISN45_At03g008300 [Arabidopsis thaliana x Arabidopsis arenosa]|uniref:Uncharacterized protein n=2 Tax=Arabidopsis TaxID=3701 RepID=A0A8T2F2D3_ARASU|nr:hypothetical protein ISN45_At03g008300 [Arabidopsis thaliana x Arabidopsis arenosa]KAG7630515.1 hypothetical protein ISN44_As03g008400 [Arabidopsis suecica]